MLYKKQQKNKSGTQLSNLYLTPDERLERFGLRLSFYAETFPLFKCHLHQYYKRLWLQYARNHIAGISSDRNSDWNDEINLRHGINSIEGTECEMMAACYYLTF